VCVFKNPDRGVRIVSRSVRADAMGELNRWLKRSCS